MSPLCAPSTLSLPATGRNLVLEDLMPAWSAVAALFDELASFAAELGMEILARVEA